MGYSSVGISGWVLAVCSVDRLVPYYAWFLYSLTLRGFMVSCNGGSKFPTGLNPSLVIFCLLIAGIPGGRIFTIKWIILSCLVEHDIFFPSYLLALSSVVSLPIYLNVIFIRVLFPFRRAHFVVRPPKWLGVVLLSSFFWSPMFGF